MKLKKETSLFYIFKTFFLIGASAFGGFTALIAVVQFKLVDRDNKIEESVIYNGLTLASILPGPVAVNTVTFIGFVLKGWKGAFIAMVSVILPSFIIIVLFAHVYLNYGDFPQVRNVINGIIPVIIAIIFSVAYSMIGKNVTSWKHLIILILGLAVQFFFTGYWVFVGSLMGSGLLGLFLFRNDMNSDYEPNKRKIPNRNNLWVLGILFIAMVTLATIFASFESLDIQLLEVFSKISLTMFGGGYVMIPVLQNIIVDNLGWLNQQEFIDAIAFGQITPGPILISAAFVGYKVSGVSGAILATLGVFGPSAILITLLSGRFKKIANNVYWKSMLEAIKPMIISFIEMSTYTPINLECSMLSDFTILLIRLSKIDSLA